MKVITAHETYALVPVSVINELTEFYNAKTPEPEESDRWLNLKQLCAYHPDNPAPATVYGWVSEGIIPVHKNKKKLRFLKSEIDQYLKEGKRKTYKEVAQEIESNFSQKTKKG